MQPVWGKTCCGLSTSKYIVTIVAHNWRADHRNAEQKAADAKHAKEQRKAEEALQAKQHEYERQQEESAEEQAVEDGEAIAKRLQSAHLGPTPSTAGSSTSSCCCEALVWIVATAHISSMHMSAEHPQHSNMV